MLVPGPLQTELANGNISRPAKDGSVGGEGERNRPASRAGLPGMPGCARAQRRNGPHTGGVFFGASRLEITRSPLACGITVGQSW